MPYEFIGKDGRVIKAPTKAEREAAYNRAEQTKINRERRKILEKENINNTNLYNKFDETEEFAKKRNYEVGLVQGALNAQEEASKTAAYNIAENAAHNAEQERLENINKVNYLKTGLSILGVASGIGTIGTKMTSSLYNPIMRSNAVINGANAIFDVKDGEYGQLGFNMLGMLSPYARFRYNKTIPTATWGRIGSDYVIDFSKHLESAGLAGDIIGLTKQIKENDDTQKKLDKMAIGGIRTIRPNVLRGGQAIPIGNNFYYMKGRKHEQGGIDVGRDLEVEGEEVMQITPKSVKVYSAQPILNGISPAKAVLGGMNPNKVFEAQEEYKDRHNLNDDGTKKKAKFGDEEKIDNVKEIAPLSGYFETAAKDVKNWGNITEVTDTKGNKKQLQEVLEKYPEFTILADANGNAITSRNANTSNIDTKNKGTNTNTDLNLNLRPLITDNESSATQYYTDIYGRSTNKVAFRGEKPIEGSNDLFYLAAPYLGFEDYIGAKTLQGAGKVLGSAYRGIRNGNRFRLNNSSGYNVAKKIVDDTALRNKINSTIAEVNDFANKDAKVRMIRALKEENSNITAEELKKLEDITLDKSIIDINDLVGATGQYNTKTNRISIARDIPENKIYETLTHEYEHLMRNNAIPRSTNTLIHRLLNSFRYNSNLYKNNLLDANYDRIHHTFKEKEALNKAYQFDHNDNAVPQLSEKSATNRELRAAIAKRYEKYIRDSISKGKTYDEAVDEIIDDYISPEELLNLLDSINGYGHSFVNKLNDDAYKLYGYDGPNINMGAEPIFNDYRMMDRIGYIKQALKKVGVTAGAVGGAQTINNKTEMKMGGKKADLGTKDETPSTRDLLLSLIRGGVDYVIDKAKTPLAIARNVSDTFLRTNNISNPVQSNSSVSRKYNAVGARLARMQADINRKKLPTKVGDIRPFGINYQALRRFNNGKYATFDNNKLLDALSGGLSAWEYNNGQTSGAIQIDPNDNSQYLVKLTDRYTFDDSYENDKAAAERHPLRKIMGIVGRSDNDPNATQQEFYYKIPINGNDTVQSNNVYPEDYVNGNLSDDDIEYIKKLFMSKDKKRMGGIINRRPFTGNRVETKTTARYGTKKKADLGTEEAIYNAWKASGFDPNFTYGAIYPYGVLNTTTESETTKATNSGVNREDLIRAMGEDIYTWGYRTNTKNNESNNTTTESENNKGFIVNALQRFHDWVNGGPVTKEIHSNTPAVNNNATKSVNINKNTNNTPIPVNSTTTSAKPNTTVPENNTQINSVQTTPVSNTTTSVSDTKPTNTTPAKTTTSTRTVGTARTKTTTKPSVAKTTQPIETPEPTTVPENTATLENTKPVLDTQTVETKEVTPIERTGRKAPNTNPGSYSRLSIKDRLNRPEQPVKNNIFKSTLSSVNNYFKNNSEEAISAGANLIGSVGSWLTNNIAINRMKAPNAPIPKLAAKLKTRININPQLDKMRETVGEYERNIRQNTASSAVALNRINRARFAGASQVNQLYGQKENAETELINKDKLNQQSVAHTNVDAYNQYQDKLTEFNNRKLDLKSENTQGLISGINSTIQNVITNRQKDRQYRNTNFAMMLGNPNLNAEDFLASGIISQEQYDKYRKIYPLNNK